MMITITELELVLFFAFVVMTAMWFRLRAELIMHRRITAEIFLRIAKGNMKVTETEDGFELEVTAK
jgi:hypothetical protein